MDKPKGQHKMSFGIKICGILSVSYSFYFLSLVVNPNTYHAPYMIRAGYIVTALCWTVFGVGILKRYSWARVGLIVIAIIYFIDYITYPPERLISLIVSRQIRPNWVIGVLFFLSVIIYLTRPKIKRQFETTEATQIEAIIKRRTMLKEKDEKSLKVPQRIISTAAKQHPLFFAWTILKLSYIYILYLEGMTEEGFYIRKANCFLGLQWYERAIISYERALIELDSAAVHSTLGYCYFQTHEYSSSVEHYRKAYKRLYDRSADIGLAVAELQIGNIDNCDEVIQELRKSNYPFKPEDVEKLGALEAEIAILKKSRQ